MKLVEMDESLLNRPVNEGFSGGEKKRNEIFQMAVLEPQLVILDETDSGLDIDALRIVADGVNALRAPDRSFLVITHYQRLLNYIVPDHVHVLVDGRIVRSGGKELALELEEKGYAWLEGGAGAGAQPVGPEHADAGRPEIRASGRSARRRPLPRRVRAFRRELPRRSPPWLQALRRAAHRALRGPGLPHPPRRRSGG